MSFTVHGLAVSQGIAIGLLLIGSLLLSNTVERILDRIRTRRLLGGSLSPRPQAEPASGPNFEQTFASGSTKP